MENMEVKTDFGPEEERHYYVSRMQHVLPSRSKSLRFDKPEARAIRSLESLKMSGSRTAS
jgi:hypothetical protein